MIKTIIVDDDLLHLESLQKMLEENFRYVEIIGTSNNVPDAVKKIDNLKPQLVFLDIEIEPLTGFDVLEMVNERDFEVIFTTSYQKYAVQAIKVSALDYIEKPVDKLELGKAMQRYRDKTGMTRINNLLENFKLPPLNQRIALPDNDGMNFFEAGCIVCCVSDNSTTYFHIKTDDPKTPVRKIAISKGLGHWEDFLFEKGFFFRVHNRYMVNINYIKRFVRTENSFLVMEHFQEHVPVARSSKNDFISFLKTKGMVF